MARNRWGERPVQRLWFGREDAERDMADGLLRDGFLFTSAYREVAEGRKMLVVGRKGSGKSAICMQLAARASGAGERAGGGAIRIAPDDAAGDELRRFALQGLTGDTARSLIWRYVFAVHAARHLVAHARTQHGLGAGRTVRGLRRFLRENGELPEANLVDRLVHGARALRSSLALEAFGFRAELHTEGNSEGARAQRQLEIVEREVQRAFERLGCARAHAPLLFLVDQLEQVWSSDTESNSMVIGLLLAAKWVAGTYAPGVRCVLFLRSDIYDALVFSERDKFHADELRIDWSPAELRELVRTRAAASLGVPLREEELWGELFPAAVGCTRTVDHLLTTALLRPRDLIQYCTRCRDVAVGEGRLERIAEADVVRAAEQFSRWKLRDLVEEYLVAHPFLEALLALFQQRKNQVSREVLGRRLDRAREGLTRDYPAYATSFRLDVVLEVLHEVGFLGVVRGERSAPVYATASELGIQPHDEEFVVHPCFRSALQTHDPAPQGALDLETTTSVPLPRLVQPQGQLTLADRDYVLINRLDAACRAIAELVDRLADAGGGPYVPAVRAVLEEVTTRTWRLREENIGVYLPGRTEEHLRWAAGRFDAVVDPSRGEGGTVPVVLREQVREETRRLERMVGGSYGGSGNSSS